MVAPGHAAETAIVLTVKVGSSARPSFSKAKMPAAVTATVCAPLSGRLVATRGPRFSLVTAGVAMTVAVVVLALVGPGTPVWVLLAAYASDFMGTKLVGNINVGLVLGLAQFVTTFVVTQAYVAYADKQLDPRSARIREGMEREGLA